MIVISYRQRVGLLALLGGCAVLVLLARLTLLQVIQHEAWAHAARKQTAVWRPVRARRGRILDARGRLLADDAAGFDLTLRVAAWEGRLHECGVCGFHRYYRLAATPGACPRCKARKFHFADERDVAEVARLLRLPEHELLGRVEDQVKRVEAVILDALKKLEGKPRERRRRMLWADHGWRSRTLVRDVSYEVAREVELEARRNPAFRIDIVHARRYPGGRDFAHLLGRTRRDQRMFKRPDGEKVGVDVARGVAGLEARFEESLRGRSGWVLVHRDPRNGGHRTSDRLPPDHGSDVQLTIDREDQARAVEALEGDIAALVVVNAETGAVLALASSPSYEPEDFNQVYRALSRRRTGKRWPRYHELQERAAGIFEFPGSVLKPFTAVAALTAGVSTPATEISCERHYVVDGVRQSYLKCHDRHDTVALHGALVRSCNIYFQTLMREMLKQERLPHFATTAERFGFGKATGVETEPRRFKNTFQLRRQTIITASIGQGDIQLTPAQVARAYAGLATGFLPRLHTVARVGGRATRSERAPLGVPAPVLATIRAALRDVPRRGTARGHGLEEWGISCKTGTAQRHHTDPNHNAWVAGFAPAQKGRPAIAFAMVIVDTPLGGADACGPRLEQFFRAFYGERTQ